MCRLFVGIEEHIRNEYNYLITGHICPLKISHIPSLCKRSSVYADAGSVPGTGFLKPYARLSTVVSEFQGHPGNGALVATISFSETRTNSEGDHFRGMGRMGNTAM
jgi:hypothetical protein